MKQARMNVDKTIEKENNLSYKKIGEAYKKL